jgi:hypothetical protein
VGNSSVLAESVTALGSRRVLSANNKPRARLERPKPGIWRINHYIYPNGPIAVEALRMIGAAAANAGVVGIED